MREFDEKSKADVENAAIDEEERKARQNEEDAKMREQERLNMSAVMQKGLPRPTVISKEMFDVDGETSSRAEKLINEEMLVLMVHDNSKYPLKGMKAKNLPKLGREKIQYSQEELERARELIDSEAKEMGAYLDEPWPAELDKEYIFLKDKMQLVKLSEAKSKEVVSDLRHQLALRNKQIEKEVKRSTKYGKVMDVMFKKYGEIAKSNTEQLQEMASDRADKLIEKEVFSTLHTLESKSVA